MSEVTKRRDARGGRRMILVLATLFLAPLALAFWLYYGTGWRPFGSTNNGELLTPARALPESAATRRADGTQLFHGKWSLVVASSDGCGRECQAGLDYARRTLASLGRLQSRTQSVLVSDPALLQAFPEPRRAQMIFVVDPLGNLMMRYDSSRDPKGLREDLQHLLDLSQIG